VLLSAMKLTGEGVKISHSISGELENELYYKITSFPQVRTAHFWIS